MNKKAQIENPFLTFIVVVIALIIMGPIMLKVVLTFLPAFSSAVGNQTAQAGTNVTAIQNTFVTFWDWVLISAFLLAIILLFITSFLVDVHPVFLILFILFGMFTFMFIPGIIDILDTIYNDANFALEVSSLAMLDFLRSNLELILLGIYFVCGVIVFAKFRYGNR